MLNVDPAVRDIERKDHQVLGVAEYRAPAGSTWLPLQVESGSISAGPLDFAPGRTMTLTAVLTDGLLDGLSIFGTWVRVAHRITRMDGDTFDIPLGYFRVDRLEVNKYAGTVEIHGSDPGSCVDDYEFVTLAQGEVPAGEITTTAVTRMLTETMAGITPWWTMLVDPMGAPAVPASGRWQYEGSRVDAVRELLNALGRRLTYGVDGRSVFRFLPDPHESMPPVITIEAGDLGNVVSLSAISDRSGIANVATVSYTATDGSQVRLHREYVTGPTAAGGPFGRASVRATGPNVETDVDAGVALDAALAHSAHTSQDFTLDVAPIYGIEVGDVVDVIDRDGAAIRAHVIGAEIPVTTKDGGWSLRLRAFEVLAATVRRVVW